MTHPHRLHSDATAPVPDLRSHVDATEVGYVRAFAVASDLFFVPAHPPAEEAWIWENPKTRAIMLRARREARAGLRIVRESYADLCDDAE